MESISAEARERTGRSDITKLKEYRFIYDTVSRFSVKGAKEYLKTSNESMVIAHLKRQISKENEKLAALQEKKQLTNCIASYHQQFEPMQFANLFQESTI